MIPSLRSSPAIRRLPLQATAFFVVFVVAVLWAHGRLAAQDGAGFLKGAQLTILQLNDVYETAPVDGRGGLARVATLKQNLARAGETPLLVIAGDFLSSSVASSVFKGEQMIAGFNAMGLDLATLGNHEFDFGKDVLLRRMAESKFQYVIANILDDATGRPVGGAATHLVRTFNGLKVGFFGLCLIEEQIGPDKRRGLRFLDPIAEAGRAVAALRAEGAQVIVALTHLSYAQDRELARRYPDIAVIVGGHEHFPISAFVGSTLISKAGSDAKQVARIDLRQDASGLERHLTLVPIDSTLRDEPTTAAVAAEYEARLGKELDTVIGATDVPLETESRRTRSGESNAGNLVADAMRADTRAEIAILNSGSIRGDRAFPPGPLTRRTLLAMQPFGNKLCEIEVRGATVLRALNAAASELPAPSGRFPQVSGIAFTVDMKRAAGDRVTGVRVGGQPLLPERTYTLALPDYLLEGGDGYDMFAGQTVRIAPSAGKLIVTAVEDYVAARRTIAPRVEGRITIVDAAR